MTQINFQSYIPLIHNLTKKFIVQWKSILIDASIDYNDLFQEASLVFVKCQNKFNNDKGSSFNSYLCSSVKNRWLSLLNHSFIRKPKRFKYNKSQLQNSSVKNKDFVIRLPNVKFNHLDLPVPSPDPIKSLIPQLYQSLNKLNHYHLDIINQKYGLNNQKPTSIASIAKQSKSSTKTINNNIKQIHTQLFGLLA